MIPDFVLSPVGPGTDRVTVRAIWPATLLSLLVHLAVVWLAWPQLRELAHLATGTDRRSETSSLAVQLAPRASRADAAIARASPPPAAAAPSPPPAQPQPQPQPQPRAQPPRATAPDVRPQRPAPAPRTSPERATRRPAPQPRTAPPPIVQARPGAAPLLPPPAPATPPASATAAQPAPAAPPAPAPSTPPATPPAPAAASQLARGSLAAPPGADTPRAAQGSPPAADLSAYVASRQRARGATPAAPVDPDAAARADLARRDAIVAENLGLNQTPAFGYDPRSAGGLFQIREMSSDAATFYFLGMDRDIGRRARQVVEVRRGDAPDIRVAVVRRMIAIIRDNVTGDFWWASQRLGREVRLSARPEDNAGLEDFILRDVFPEARVP